jgi:uncharacterized membrane protein
MKVMWTGIFLPCLRINALIRWTLCDRPYIITGERRVGTLDLIPYGAANDRSMVRLWETGLDWVVFWIAVLVLLVAVGYWIIKKLRPKPIQKEREADQWLSKCHELHSKGVLSDEEFRTINLAARLQDELKDNGEKG